MRDIGSIHEVKLVVGALLPDEVGFFQGRPLRRESSTSDVSSNLDRELVDMLFSLSSGLLRFEVERGVGSMNGMRGRRDVFVGDGRNAG